MAVKDDKNEITERLHRSHLMPTGRYGTIEYFEWCHFEANRINKDPRRNAFVKEFPRSREVCIAEDVASAI